MKLKRTDLDLLRAANANRRYGIQSAFFSAGARRRMLKDGYITESDTHVWLGKYRSTLQITQSGIGALNESLRLVRTA